MVYAAVFVGLEAWGGWDWLDVFEPHWFSIVVTSLMLSMSAIELGALWLVFRGVSWGRHALVALHALTLLGLLAIGVLSDDSSFNATLGTDDVVPWIGATLQMTCVAWLYSRPAQPWFSRPRPA